MNDDETLAALRSSLTGVKESLTDVHLHQSADAIRARARGRRMRRGLAGAGAGSLALGVGLALAVGGGSGTGARPVHVNLDAWSVNTQPNGLVYVDVRELVNPVLLRQTLARAGVPAIVTFGKICTGPSSDAGNPQHVLSKTVLGGEPKLTINPAAIPAGSELSIGIVSMSKHGVPGLTAGFGLVKEDSPLTCGTPAAEPGVGRPDKGPGAGPVAPGGKKGQGPVVPGAPPTTGR